MEHPPRAFPEFVHHAAPWNVPYETAAFEAVSLVLGSRKERRWWIDGLSSGADSDSLDKEQRAHHP